MSMNSSRKKKFVKKKIEEFENEISVQVQAS
jgi:hypothetical protein